MVTRTRLPVLFGIHPIAVLVAAFAGFVVGALWYGPLFGDTWAHLSGIVPTSDERANAGASALLTFATKLLLAALLAAASNEARVARFGRLRAPLVALALWAGLVVPVTAFLPLWFRVAGTTWLFIAADWLVVLLVMAGVFAIAGRRSEVTA
jgi:hypothetical protein